MINSDRIIRVYSRFKQFTTLYSYSANSLAPWDIFLSTDWLFDNLGLKLSFLEYDLYFFKITRTIDHINSNHYECLL